MSGRDDALNAIGTAIDALREKRAATTDANEKDTLNNQISDLEAQREAINDAKLGDRAQLVADAAAALDDIVKAAEAGPLDAPLAKLHDAVASLKTAQQELSAPEPQAEDKTDAARPAPAPAPVAPPVSAPQTAPVDFTDLLRRAMDQLGMASRSLRAGTAAICFGESGFHPRREASYTHTSAARIRDIFGSRVASLSDAEIDALKANDEQFFELVYGGAFGRAQLGNTQPGDGFRFIGRGPIQLTGRGNYAKYGRLIRVDLIGQPDLANDPETGCKLTVAYMKDRYHGGGFDAMKRAVGNVVATTETVKDAAFAKFTASGLFGGTEA